MTVRDAIAARVRSGHASAIALSHRIHAHPELGYEEVRAAAWVGDALATAGFDVEPGACDMPTALVATIGSGPLTVGLCAEYDALPGMGHACGHNIIAAVAGLAASALARFVDDIGITLKVFGTPAEEFGGGKIRMLERGAFDGVNAALIIHPAARDCFHHLMQASSPLEV
jgi:amidohydrolase